MATLGTVNVKITGDISGLVSSLNAAGLQVVSFDKKVRQLGVGVGPQITKQARGLSNLGRAFTNAAGQAGVLNSEISILASSVGNIGMGAIAAGIGMGALVGGLVKSAQAAITFETAITKVAKTANLSAEEAKDFGNAMLDMSKRLPVATSGLTDVAVVAGQLGIQGVQNIANFVEEVAKLASTTGVDAGTLATSLGSIMQVTGTAPGAIGGFSAAITQLGNDFNSTEGQILEFTTRIAGVGTAIGLTATQMAAISNAFASVGVEAERGGTAIQRVFVALQAASERGGKELEVFASTVGMTGKAFQELVKSDPAEAFTKFVEGLTAAGSGAVSVLDELGLADQRLIASFLSVANAGGLMRRSISTAESAAAEGTATNEEFARSSATTAAQIQLLKNQLNVLAVNVGNTLLPALTTATTGITALFEGAEKAGPAVHLFSSAVGELAKALVIAGSAFAAIKMAGFVHGLAAARVAAVAARIEIIRTAQAAAVAQAVASRAAMASMMSAGPLMGMGMAGGAAKIAMPGMLGGLVAGINPVTAAVVGLTVGFVGLDMAMRRFKGESFLSWLTGAKKKAEEAAAAQRMLADETARLQYIIQTGGPAGGFADALDPQIERVEELTTALDRLKQEEAAWQGRGKHPQWKELNSQIKEAEGRLDAVTGSIHKLFAELPEEKRAVFRISLQMAIGDDKDLAKEFADELDRGEPSWNAWNSSMDEGNRNLLLMNPALRTAADNFFVLKTSVDGVNEAMKGYADVVSAAAASVIPKAETDPILANLEVAIAEAEDLKNRMGDAWTDAMQAGLDATKAQRQGYLESFEVLSAKITAVGATYIGQVRSVSAAVGGNITQAVNDATEDVGRLLLVIMSLQGQEIQTEIVARLPLVSMKSWETFFKTWDGRAITLDIFLRGIERARAQLEGLTSVTFAGKRWKIGELGPPVPESMEDKYPSTSGGGGGGGGGGANPLVSALSDGVISLSEALELGLSDAEAAALELGEAQKVVAAERFREQVGLQAIAQAFPGLDSGMVKFRLGLAAIADHIRKTGQTIEQFIYDTATTALEGFKSAFDAIFSQPSRESLELDTRKAELELKRSLLLRTRPDDDPRVEAIDKQIEAIESEISIRQLEMDVMQGHMRLRDQSLATDLALMSQAALLATAIEKTSTEVAKMEPIVFYQTMAMMNVGNAANEVAASFRSLDSAIPTTIPGKASGGYASGLTLVGERGPEVVRLPRGSYVYPNNRFGEAGASGGNTAYITINSTGSQDAASADRLAKSVIRILRDELGMQTLAGPRLPAGAFSPRRA